MDYLGKNIPKLGFGLMRLPMLGENVDIEQTKAMVDHFLAAGFTYFDTAYGYLNGKSESAAKEALVARYPRERFQLATKLPAWADPKTADEAKQMFYTSLERTGAGYFDFYLLHNCGDTRTDAFDRFGIWDFTLSLKEKGLIKHVGFSFHDKADVLDELLNKHPEMEFVQLQINYADWESDSVQSRKCLEIALKHNKPVIIMEPIKGGLLANPPKSVADVLNRANSSLSPAAWALYFAASQPNIITVLSGMSTLEQMQQNVKTMTSFRPLDKESLEAINKARTALNAIPSIPCTNCQYCVKGCPMSIPIPSIFSAMNTNLIYQNIENAKGSYRFATREGNLASTCISCGQCESVCPQHIQIIEHLQECAHLFEK